ncbi:MAG: cysteine desulfurase [Candidatus Omnitrophica bacterium]|nr:cysteine desulfurase [Candidatus Omnitrophota bacterium]
MNNQKTEFNVEKVRAEFPNLSVKVHGKPLVYFDNAATTFKPRRVIDALKYHYEHETSNVHRGVHTLSEKATTAYEGSRKKIQEFLNAASTDEIIFTGGTTDGINLVAQSYGRAFLREGNEILISEMEHHSNIVPWQMVAEEKKCVLKIIPFDDNGNLDFPAFKRLLNEKTKIISVVYVSNSLGTVNPVRDIIKEAHRFNVPVLLDAAQAVSYELIDVQELDCDFLAFSSHKLFGPTGVGILYGKANLLDKMPPYKGGGDMISSVTFKKTLYNKLPYKFEAGTPNIADVIGLGAAIDFVSEIGLENTKPHRRDLLDYASKRIMEIPGIKIIGQAKSKTSILSFIHSTVHAHDMGTLVDEEGVAIRTGHHCTQPVMDHFGISATSRASFAMYNTKSEIDQFIEAVKKAIDIFQ